MARDVEFDVTANDKTAAALRAAERNFARTNKKIKDEQKKTSDLLGGGLLGSLDKVAPKLAESLSTSLAHAGKIAGPALAGAIALALPLVGASASAAIIGGAGLGGVVGGVMLAAKDPRVAAAGSVLGDTLMSQLEDSADSFVDPVLRNIDKIESKFTSLGPRLDRIFSNSAGYLDPLVDGALRAVDGISAGLEVLTRNAGPVMDELGDELGDIGEALGEMLATISGGSEDAAAALNFLGDVTANSIIIFGRAVRLLTEVFGFFKDVQDTIGDVIPFMDVFADQSDRIGGSGTFAGEGARNAAAGFDTERVAGVELTATLEQAEDAVRGVYQANLDLYSSMTNVAEAVARATGTIEENGRTLSLATEKGRENRDALADVAGALQRQYDAYVKVNGAGAGSAAVAEDLRGKFVKLATQAGLSATAANHLADEILDIPSSKTAKINADTAVASNEVKDLQRRINEVRGKTVTVNVNVNAAALNKVNRQLGRSDPEFSANSYWGAADVNTGMARVGGPDPLSVTSNVQVSLDGRPFYQASVRAAQDVNDRAAWRQKVGTR